jgi:putative transposase
MSSPRREPPRRRPGPGRPAHGNVRDPGRRERRRGADVAPDLVHRVFHAERPNALSVSDLTYVRTTEGMAYVCFVVDATRCMIVGWQVASQMTVQTVLRALEVARLRRGAFHAGLSFSLDRAHSDAGSQY